MDNRYSEARAEEQGIRAAYAAGQTWQDMCLAGMQQEAARLKKELAHAKRVAATIPDLELMISSNAEKMARFEAKYQEAS